jgi:hypothetical protein
MFAVTIPPLLTAVGEGGRGVRASRERGCGKNRYTPVPLVSVVVVLLSVAGGLVVTVATQTPSSSQTPNVPSPRSHETPGVAS